MEVLELLPILGIDIKEEPSEIRVLTEEEITSVAEIFTQNSVPLPNPANSFFMGAIQDGKVVGFLVIQLAIHAEPMWIKPGHESVFQRLASEAERTIQERTGGGCVVYLFAPAGKVSRLAQVVGMRVEPWVVMSKFVAPRPLPPDAPSDCEPLPDEEEPIIQ